MKLARSLLVVLVVALTGFAGGVGGSASAQAAASDAATPAAFVSTMAERAVEALAVPDIAREERVRRFRNLLNDHFAVKTIGRWVLGKYWRRASKAEQEEYLGLIEDLIVMTYVDRFASYKGEDLVVIGTETVGKRDHLVRSQLSDPNRSTPVAVDWRVRTGKSGGFAIIDVMVEGISMGMTQRSEFASVIKRSGGKVEGLLEELRERLRRANEESDE